MVRLSNGSTRAIAASAFVALLALHLNVGQAAQRATDNEPIFQLEEAIYLPPVPVLKTLALGRHTFAADLLWMRALSYFAVHFQGDKDYRWLNPLIETILDLDPDYRKVYHWAAVVVMYGRGIDNSSVLASNRILESAVDRFPDDWMFHFILGCNLTFELRSEDPEQLARWRRRGAEQIRVASTLEGAPSWLPITAVSLHSKLGQQELAIRHMEEVYLHTDNDELKAQLANMIAARKGDHARAKLQEYRQRFQASWRRSFPYLPPDLFSMVGDRMTPRVEAPWLD